MKLILVLSIIAYGYADKLDRAYLPPANAASSGGSPGSLIAPKVQPEAFGQGAPVSGHQPGLNDFRKPITSQNGLSGNSENRPEAASFASTIRSSGVENSAVPSYGNGHGTSTRISASSGSNNPAPSSIPQFSSNRYGDSNENLPSAGQSASDIYNQRIGPGAQGINGITQVYNQERPQAAADRNAETLKYINENNGESYSYSYETSNGISAEESGIAINGVMAQGGYAYTGDDGKAYSISYTADENGYQPQGEHLPTPHPIPEEILKSIEENAKAAAAGIQEGAYRPEEYESEDSQQQYNFGSGSSYQSQPGQEQSQGPASNPTNNNQYQAGNQGIREQNRFIDQSGQNGPVNQQYNKNSDSSQGFERQNPEENKQGNQGFIQGSSQSYKPRPSQSQAQSVSGQLNSQLSNHESTIQNAGQFSQNQEHGYQYNQPQKPFTPQSSLNQYRPQASSQRQNAFASLPSAGSVFVRSQDSLKPSLGNRPSSDLYKSQQSQSRIGLNQQSPSANRPLSESGSNRPQNQVSFSKQNQVNQNNQPFSFQERIPAGQGYKYQPKQPSQGFNKPSLINDLGSHNEGISKKPSFYSNNNQKQGPLSSSYESSNPQFQQVQKRPSYGSSSVPSQNSQIFKKIQNSASVNNQAEQSPQFSQNANKPSFNYNQSPNQISQYQQSVNQPSFGNRQPGQVSNIPSISQGFGFNNFGPKPSVSSRPVQAPYQNNKPSQSFTTQPPNFLPLDSQSSKGKSGQENQDRSEEFEGPRQPPSFNSQEGYKY